MLPWNRSLGGHDALHSLIHGHKCTLCLRRRSSRATLEDEAHRWSAAAYNRRLCSLMHSKDTAWAHIDIAGPVWSDKGKGVNPAGATGYGVRTLVNWVLAQS